MGAVIVVDAMWGDSGKGKTTAHLARKFDASLAVRASGGSNAGASVTLDDGTVVRSRQFPLGWLNPSTRVAIGSGVLIDPRILAREIEQFEIAGRATIDRRCAVITPEHIAAEQEDSHLTGEVGSTCSGTGYARADFVLRRATQARDVAELAPFLDDVATDVNRTAEAATVIVQGAQGTFLSLALSDDYPHTTSGNCTATAAMNDVGLNWRLVDEVIMVVKAMPSRVGQGRLPGELSDVEIAARGIGEFGVHTGRPRRKAIGLDLELLAYATMLNGPTQIALTFCDHLDPAMKGVQSSRELTAPVRELIEEVEKVTGVSVTMVDTGPRLSDMIDLVTA